MEMSSTIMLLTLSICSLSLFLNAKKLLYVQHVILCTTFAIYKQWHLQWLKLNHFHDYN